MLDLLLEAKLPLPTDTASVLGLYTAAVASTEPTPMLGRVCGLLQLPSSTACPEGAELLRCLIFKGQEHKELAHEVYKAGACPIAAARLIFALPAAQYSNRPELSLLPELLHRQHIALSLRASESTGETTGAFLKQIDELRRMEVKCHLSNTGLVKSTAMLASCYRHLAGRGDMNAVRELATILEKGGEGVPKDYPAAGKLLLQLMDAGDSDARDTLWQWCKAYTHDLSQAVNGAPYAIPNTRVMAMAAVYAEQNDPGAFEWLGKGLYHGYHVPMDRPASVQWWRKLADAHATLGVHGMLTAVEVETLRILAEFSEKGLYGVAKDIAQACELYKRLQDGLASSHQYCTTIGLTNVDIWQKWADETADKIRALCKEAKIKNKWTGK